MSAPGPIFIAGPTAVGKSAVALLLAERIGGEIVSVDSMQVYRGLDIGAAKPSAEERRRVRHHLLDVVDVTEPFDAARFVQLAQAAIRDIQLRERTPILCGGSGLYFKALVSGLGQGVAAAPALRATLENTPLPELLVELQQRDPVLYERIDRNNRRRVIRAIEVIRQSGRPFSEQQANWTTAAPSDRAFLLSRSKEDLHNRIDARVEEMFRCGLVDEARRLLKQGLATNRTAMQALGYRQIVEHLEGKCSLLETVETIKVRTRQFAKRQLTWFRRYFPGHWLHLQPETSAESVGAQILSRLPGST